ncbi:MAG: FAD-binding oxidoreductase [Patescibacteria group bacterium]
MNIEEIKKLSKVLDDVETLRRYSVDASIFSVRPKAVALPKSKEELIYLINWAQRSSESGQKVSLSPRNAGTCMSGGSLTEDIMVDMTDGFSWVDDDVNQGAKTVWVGSGTLYRDLDAILAPLKLLFAPLTSSKDICGIGGMIGNNASGEKSMRYGATIDNVRSVKVILQDGKEYEFGPLNASELQAKLQLQTDEGNIYKSVVKLLEDNWQMIWDARPNVRKNAAGYQLWRIWDRDKTEFNLAKLFVGSQGTLGFITSAELIVVPRPEFARMLVVPIDNLGRLAKAVKCIVAHHPEGLETYDKHTYALAKEHMPDQAALAHIAEGQEMVLFAQFSEKSKDETDHAENACQLALKNLGFEVSTIKNDAEADAHWAIRRASFKLLMDHAKGVRAVPFIEDTIVAIEHYGEYLAALEAILADYQMTYTFAGHIGDGSIRLIPLVDMEDPAAPDMILSLARRVYDLVFAFGGSMSVDHNDGLIRTSFLERMYGPEVVTLFNKTKDIFDPLNIFNPGKKVRGSLEFSKNHMIKTNN